MINGQPPTTRLEIKFTRKEINELFPYILISVYCTLIWNVERFIKPSFQGSDYKRNQGLRSNRSLAAHPLPSAPVERRFRG